MNERRPEDYDRDFAQLVSGLELGGGPESSPPPADPPDLSARRTPRAHPSDPDWFSMDESLERAEPDEPDASEWKPDPLPAPRFGTLALVSLGLFGYCLVVLLLVIFGAKPAPWVGWTAAAAFVAAMLIGWRALPRDRDPGDGDGAVV
ncbi:hypothetical protein HJ590_02880 [Naumannella sp. ID2617S]|uniref:Uncharacterized protein n=1 Tax=Enemella dayhoffiae TaxID=2016507 RepID=A0A255HE58_9ACTN|nr:hypothetical protein [Enemella dayhoffiae]NNG18532.1 hypothetical protein [Naumannella sp. ID2617S]OYO24624.1 hypothetical protein CGZ93_02675 [Enemella dayhoffiae]